MTATGTAPARSSADDLPFQGQVFECVALLCHMGKQRAWQKAQQPAAGFAATAR